MARAWPKVWKGSGATYESPAASPAGCPLSGVRLWLLTEEDFEPTAEELGSPLHSFPASDVSNMAGR